MIWGPACRQYGQVLLKEIMKVINIRGHLLKLWNYKKDNKISHNFGIELFRKVLILFCKKSQMNSVIIIRPHINNDDNTDKEKFSITYLG